MLQIILSLLLTFTGDAVRPLAWMLCTPTLAGHVPPVPMLWLMPPQQYRALESLHLPPRSPISAAQRPVSHRGLATAKDSQEATSKWNSVTCIMTRMATLRLHRDGIERLTPYPLAQPGHSAFYAASSLDSQLELCILSQEAPHKKGWGGKEVAMFTDLFLLSCSLKEFSNT